MQKLYLFCLLSLTLLLNGCWQSATIESATSDYASRLSRVLGIEVAIPSPNVALHYPDSQARQLTIPRKTIKLSEFYAINNCPLAPLIAQRNTALGKVETPSRRYVYELDVIAALESCATQVSAEQTHIRSKLDELLRHKRSVLPMVRAQLLQDSEALRLGTGFSHDFLEFQDGQYSEGMTETRLALDFLADLSERNALTYHDIETHLAAIEKHRLLAKMWRTQRYISQTLPILTDALNTVDVVAKCTSQQWSDKQMILRNVLNMFFVEQIQGIGSQLNAYHYQLSPLLQRISDEVYLAPAVRAYWASHYQQGFDTYQASIKAHVKAWQNILQPCS